MSNFNSADIAAFKDVWVFCEQREGKLMPTDFELISEGRKLADDLGVELCGLLLGDNVDQGHELFQTERFVIQHEPPAFDLAHLQNIVDQAYQVVR